MTDTSASGKKCRMCGVLKDKELFYGRRTKCKDCYNKKRREKTKKKRSYASLIKAIRGCIDCDEKDPHLLDFDHIDPDTKENRVSRIVNGGAGIEKVKEEIDKCEVRCSNCHRKKTAKTQQWFSNMDDLKKLRLQTFTGKMFYPFDPKEEQVSIEDIAHSLSMQCRYNGHMDDFHSVAQHSVYTSQIVDEEFALTALMHDAEETYLGDMPSPVKSGMYAYKELEQSVWEVIASKFGLHKEKPKAVKYADLKILMAEKRDLITDFGWNWGIDVEPAELTIKSVPPKVAKQNFLERFDALID